MQLECPKCGCKLGNFDIKETQSCPSCGVGFTGEIQPISPMPAPLPKALPPRVSANRLPLGCLLLLTLPCPGIVALLIAMSTMSDAGFRLGIFGGLATAAVLSVVVSGRIQGVQRQAFAIVAFFSISLFVNAFIFFHGCAMVVGYGR